MVGVFGAVDADHTVLVVDIEPRRGGRNGTGRRDLRLYRQGVIGNHGGGTGDGSCRAGIGQSGGLGVEAFQRGENRQAGLVFNIDLSIVTGTVGVDAETYRAPVFRDGNFHFVFAHGVCQTVRAGNVDVGSGNRLALDFRTVDHLSVSDNRSAFNGGLVVDQAEEGISLADNAPGDKFAGTLAHLLDELVVIAHIVNVKLNIDFVAVNIHGVVALGGFGTRRGVGVAPAVIVEVVGHIRPACIVAVGRHSRNGIGVSGTRRVNEDTAVSAGSLHSGGVRDGLVGRGLLLAGEVGDTSHAGNARQVTAPRFGKNLALHGGVALGGIADIERLRVGVGRDKIFVGFQHKLAFGEVLGIDKGVAVSVTAEDSLPQREGSDGTLSAVGSAVADTVRNGGRIGVYLQPDGALVRQTHFVNVVLSAVGGFPDNAVVVGGGLAALRFPERDDVGKIGTGAVFVIPPPAAALVLGVGVLKRDGYFLLRKFRININVFAGAVRAVDDVRADELPHKVLRILERHSAVVVGGDIVIVACGVTRQTAASAQVDALKGQTVL